MIEKKNVIITIFSKGLILQTDYSLTPGINVNSLANIPGS